MKRSIGSAAVMVAVLALASCAKNYEVAPLDDLGAPTAPAGVSDAQPGPLRVAGGETPADESAADAVAELSRTWAAELLATLAAHPAPAGRTVTVLMPTDDAFAALPVDQASALLSDPDALGQLVQRHVLAANIPLEWLGAMATVPTLAGSDLTVSTTGTTLQIGGASVVDVAVNPGVDGQSPSYVFLSVDQVLLTSV